MTVVCYFLIPFYSEISLLAPFFSLEVNEIIGVSVYQNENERRAKDRILRNMKRHGLNGGT